MAKQNGRLRQVNVIEVILWEQQLGAIALDKDSGFYAFSYTPEFKKQGIEIAPLQMPLAGASIPFLFSTLPIDTYKRLPAIFADSLPDEFGNALINKYMADKGIPMDRITVLDRLAYMGSRAMGALEFRPVIGTSKHKPTAIELKDIVIGARAAIEGSLDNDSLTKKALGQIIEVGTSAGGARAKAVISINQETNEIRSGQIAAPSGFEHWLLKFDGLGADRELGNSQSYGRIEYAYSKMAVSAGIDMSECRLLEENGRHHFMTKRFDRSGNERILMQTACSMGHLDFRKIGANAYEQLFLILKELGLPYEGKKELFRRMVFNCLGMNCDDHTKNFSFLQPRNTKNWVLSPAYDISFAHNPNGEWTNQHLLSVNGKWVDQNRTDYLAVAERFGIGEGKIVIDEVAAVMENWPHFAREAGVGERDVERIWNFIKVPIAAAKK